MDDTDFILRGDAISMCREVMLHFSDKLNVIDGLNLIPASEVIPATEEAAVMFLTESGWMEKHDKEVWKKAEDYCASWDRAVRYRECQGMW